MKISLAKTLTLAAIASLLISPSLFAKKAPLTLSGFAGKYTGFVTLTTSGGTDAGTAAVTITVPKKGKSATMQYSATFVSGGMPSVLPADFVLAKNKTISTTDLGVGIAGTNNAHPGDGTWTQRKKSFSFSATDGTTTLTGTAKVKDTRKKRKLTLILVSSDGASTYTFTTTLTAKLPKPKK